MNLSNGDFFLFGMSFTALLLYTTACFSVYIGGGHSAPIIVALLLCMVVGPLVGLRELMTSFKSRLDRIAKLREENRVLEQQTEERGEER